MKSIWPVKHDHPPVTEEPNPCGECQGGGFVQVGFAKFSCPTCHPCDEFIKAALVPLWEEARVLMIVAHDPDVAMGRETVLFEVSTADNLAAEEVATALNDLKAQRPDLAFSWRSIGASDSPTAGGRCIFAIG